MMQEENKRPEQGLTEDRFSAFEQVSTPKSVQKKRLGRNTRTLVIMTAVAAALALLLAILLPLLSEQNASSSAVSGDVSALEQVYPLYDRSKDDTKNSIVQTVNIKNQGSEYTIRYHADEKVYKLVGYDDLTLAASGVDTLIDCSTTLNAYNRVNTVENLKDFGLDKPQATVTVIYHDNTQNTLRIGNATPDEAGYYVHLAGDDEVYIVEEGSVSYFLITKEQYVDRTLLTMPTAKEDDTEASAVLKELTVKHGSELLSLRRTITADGLEFSYATYVITKPYKRMVDESITEKLNGFNYLVAMQATVLHPTAADKQKYGFTNPYATLDITLAVETVRKDENTSNSSTTQDSDAEAELEYYNEITSHVTVGSKDENGYYYVMVDGFNAIYEVASTSLSDIADRTYENTISELLFIKNITEIGQVRITEGEKNHNFIMAHDDSKEDVDDQLTIKYDGKTISTPNFRQFYSLMMGLSRYGAAPSAVTGKADYTMQLLYNDSKPYLSLDFFKTGSSLYTVRTTEGELFTVKASDITNLLTQMHNLIEGKTITS